MFRECCQNYELDRRVREALYLQCNKASKTSWVEQSLRRIKQFIPYYSGDLSEELKLLQEFEAHKYMVNL
jgi:hypothetical protein